MRLRVQLVRMSNFLAYLTFLVAMISVKPAVSVPLNIGFYQKTCPSAETIVRNTVAKAFANDSGIAAPLVRLHFHDCFVRGCDASILLDSRNGNKAEKDSMGNKGVQGFELIDLAKSQLESICPRTVSCADIIAFAARDSVFITGGFNYSVPSGRRDGKYSFSSEVMKNLPDSFFNITQLVQNFARKGLTLEDMVTLSGAHSIGDSHCSSFSKRLYDLNTAQYPSMDLNYAKYLKTKCPNPKSNNLQDPLVAFDPLTPTVLDNKYYTNLKNYKGLLGSDQVLWTSYLTRKIVKNYANHQREWASKFAAAMVRMGSVDVLTGNFGEIRKNCRVVN